MATLLDIKPDKEWSIVEEKVRLFPIDVDMPVALRNALVARQLKLSIDKLEQQGWKFISTVPSRKKWRLPTPCCSDMAQLRPGAEIPIRYLQSPYQGDTDDAHNNQTVLVAPEEEIARTGLLHLVAVCHFWEPKVWVKEMEHVEFLKSLDEKSGFVSVRNLEPELVATLTGGKYDDKLYRSE